MAGVITRPDRPKGRGMKSPPLGGCTRDGSFGLGFEIRSSLYCAYLSRKNQVLGPRAKPPAPDYVFAVLLRGYRDILEIQCRQNLLGAALLRRPLSLEFP